MRGSSRLVLYLAVLAAGCVLSFWLQRGLAEEPGERGPRQSPTVDSTGTAFVGSERCATCHEEEHVLWSESHHRHAMEPVSQDSVLGAFNGSAVERDGERVEVRREGGRYWFRITDAAGASTDVEALYTFGWAPLQQYLVPGPGGRLQAFDLAWDSEAGRWFDLFPQPTRGAGDPLHWSGSQMNWNFTCADCHSTGLRRNYDAATDSFATTWSEVTLGCESCHGAGGEHVAWAEGKAPAETLRETLGLSVVFPDPAGGWVLREGEAIAQWEGEARQSPELAVCGPCHAHRRVLTEAAAPDAALLGVYLPSLLDEGLYRPDGRQEAEVYILGSFLQSRMAAAGVVCSDCHEPHAALLEAEGNALCTQCHRAEVFDSVEHHHHETGSEGAACVSCHMPADRYMLVDERRDHGFHVPGAALAAVGGVVDACASCHVPGIWPQAAALGWWSEGDVADLARASALALGRARGVDAAAALAALAQNGDEPAIVRATALSLLGGNLQPSKLPALLQGLRAKDPLIRLGAVRGVAALPLAERFRALRPLFDDPVKAIRLEVASVLSAVPLRELPPAEAAALAGLFDEMLAAERLFLDRPESHYNIAGHLANQGDFLGAERAYRAALARDETFVPAYVNLAELQRAAGSESLALATLERGLGLEPEAAALHYALGLALYRQGDRAAALAALAQAAQLEPGDASFAYGHALALRESGQGEAAVVELRRALAAHPNDRAILYALVSFLAEDGKQDEALPHARHLAALEPEDPAIADLLRRLGG